MRATTTLKAFEGYSFGLNDERVLPVRSPLSGLPLTDGKGTAMIPVELDEVPDATKPLEARLTIRMREASGRAVERSLTVPVERLDTMIGVKPAFAGGQIGDGETAKFDVIAVAPDGARAGLADVTWNLVKIERNFQWYQVNGSWNYEPVTYTKRVASGRFDLTADAAAEIAAKVEWGRYRLEVAGADASGPATSVEFNAGWYVQASAGDTPDMLQVTLDKQAYKPGETARVNITPRFAGTALVQVVSDRLITMKPVEVSEAGATVELPVGEDWGAGVYVTATLFRPADVAKSRMPGRALGLQWLRIDASERTTSVEFDVPPVVRPRQPLDVLVSIPGLPKGERALLTVAAVDVGILNLTGYTPPAPEKWYFGQRRLGTEFRDIYGQLIDGMQGADGKIRTGGGGPLEAGMKGSPPAQKPVALFSGIVEAGSDGKATVSFDVPEFNGTLRLMAVAWTNNGVGSGTTDVTVRDPVVVTASLPRFLAPGDTSRLRLDIDNAEGPAGDYQVTVEGSEHVTLAGPDEPITLEAGKRRSLDVPLTGVTTGIGEVTVRLTHSSGIDLSQNPGAQGAPSAAADERTSGRDPQRKRALDHQRRPSGRPPGRYGERLACHHPRRRHRRARAPAFARPLSLWLRRADHQPRPATALYVGPCDPERARRRRGDQEASTEGDLQCAVRPVLDWQLRPVGTGVGRPLAQRLCHRLPDAGQGARLRRPRTGARPGAQQPAEHARLRAGRQDRRPGHRLCPLCAGAQPAGHRGRPALLRRHQARRVRIGPVQGPCRRRSGALWRDGARGLGFPVGALRPWKLGIVRRLPAQGLRLAPARRGGNPGAGRGNQAGARADPGTVQIRDRSAQREALHLDPGKGLAAAGGPGAPGREREHRA